MIKIPVIKKLFKTKKSTMEMSESDKEDLNYNEALFDALFKEKDETLGEPIKWIKASDIKPDDEWMKENKWDEIYETESEEKE